MVEGVGGGWLRGVGRVVEGVGRVVEGGGRRVVEGGGRRVFEGDGKGGWASNLWANVFFFSLSTIVQ